MTTIPATIDEVTPAWLSEVLDTETTAATPTQIGVGVGVSSALYRVAVEGPGVPASVVVKLPALDEAAVFTSTVLRMYIREVGFFRELAGRCPIRVPACHHAAVDEETSRFVVVMEDLGGMRTVDQLEGMALADAERAIDELAAWHATWWGEAGAVADAGLAVPLSDPIYTAILPMVFAEGWAKVTNGMNVSDAVLAAGPRWTEAMPRLLAELAEAPATLTHGDYRADNILFTNDDRVALIDFQLTGTGRGAYDLAYFITQSLDPEVAAVHEAGLVERWCAGLESSGVPAADVVGAWEDYRKAALFCLVYPIVASRGMDLADPRQYNLVDCMITRASRAIDQLNLVDLL